MEEYKIGKLIHYMEFDPRDYMGYESEDVNGAVIKVITNNPPNKMFSVIRIERVPASVNHWCVKYYK
jgi:hypothetical protein